MAFAPVAVVSAEESRELTRACASIDTGKARTEANARVRNGRAEALILCMAGNGEGSSPYTAEVGKSVRELGVVCLFGKI